MLKTGINLKMTNHKVSMEGVLEKVLKNNLIIDIVIVKIFAR